MVTQPGDYPWSSHAANAGYRQDPLLAPHPEYLALGPDRPTRATAYRALFEDALGDEVIAAIRAHLQQQKALGCDRFQSWVEARTGTFAGVRRPGRPSVKTNCP